MNDIAIYGKRGCGMTLTLTYLALKEYKKRSKFKEARK